MRVKIIAMAALLFALLSMAAPGVVQAGLIGATVNVSAYFPNNTTVFNDPGNRVVAAGLEYPAGSYPTYNPSWSVDISDTQIIITDTLLGGSEGLPFAPASFNGFILTVISGPPLGSASLDGASGFAPVGISIVGNQLQLNFQGVSRPVGTSGPLSSIIDINSSTRVPGPATLVLLAVGLAGMGLMRRKAS